jgi:hypothetical protein
MYLIPVNSIYAASSKAAYPVRTQLNHIRIPILIFSKLLMSQSTSELISIFEDKKIINRCICQRLLLLSVTFIS